MRLRKFTVALLLMATTFIVSLVACTKNDTGCEGQDLAAEDKAMLAFMTAKGIKGTKTSQGMYYEIVAEGSIGRPKSSSIIYCTYKGTLLNDSIFDQQTNPGRTGFQLTSLIQGWQIGIPKIGKGGTIKMVIPSNLAYGCKGSGAAVPPNSPLYFEVSLVDFF